MLPARTVVLTSLAMLAFAGNSVLCRVALAQTGIDPASFTSIRLASGAVVLWLVVRLTRQGQSGGGSWGSALALFGYAACFSFAYVSLTAATGALLLFGAVQATMIGHGLRAGERFTRWQVAGLVLALGGLVGLLLPGLAAPPLGGALLMMTAGVAWGVYSLRGKGAGDPTRVTAGNFLRAVPLALGLSLLMLALGDTRVDAAGVWLAVLSGAGASAIGHRLRHLVHGPACAQGNQRRHRAAERAGAGHAGRHSVAGRGRVAAPGAGIGGHSGRHCPGHSGKEKSRRGGFALSGAFM